MLKTKEERLIHSILNPRKFAKTEEERVARKKSQRENWVKENPEARLASNRKSHYLIHYGITFEETEKILENQDGKCAICSDSISFDGAAGAHLDHNDFGIRGVLCAKCNKGLGLFNDNINNLLNAINYLKKKKFILLVSPFEKAG
jgi:hypothetical protein